ncbi:DUF2177 family protein [Aestuariibacter sp. AA17]|uniref:DUF2177 family protein n=1 Tax=Fluctibacter corallii TaxID=2984329 RepID=A0ABT3AA37_9ALTE|nr:DUF2177 family protein [Aestuariibacter sp. AA17]MCV2885142.1 DUF2177 family protein [Aestuariibacter sp. AA17]
MCKFRVWVAVYSGIIGSYLIADGIWLGLIAKSSYQEAMASMMRENPPIWPWVTFYLVYSFVIQYLVVMPGLRDSLSDSPDSKSSTAWVNIGLSGALLGLGAYGAYNLTNYALIADWPLSITIKDWTWGTCVSAISALSGWYVGRKLIASY